MFEYLIYKAIVFYCIVWMISFVIVYFFDDKLSERMKKIITILSFIIVSPIIFVLGLVSFTILYALFLELIS
jgi:hypothetical protein